MKKLLAVLMCVVLSFAVAGCGDKKDENATEKKIEVNDKANDDQKKDDANNDVSDTENTEKNTNAEQGSTNEPENTEAPVIESAEELENIVTEFNTTEDPERKEELRKKLEAILSQAEAAAEAAGNAQ